MTIPFQFLPLLMIWFFALPQGVSIGRTRPVNKCLFSLFNQMRQIDATCVYTVFGIYTCFISPLKVSAQGERCQRAANSPYLCISIETNMAKTLINKRDPVKDSHALTRLTSNTIFCLLQCLLKKDWD